MQNWAGSQFKRQILPLGLAALLALGLYALSPYTPAWSCLGARLYVALAQGGNCRTKCTDWNERPCAGYSSCYDKDISCSAGGSDQNGRSCRGCCFACKLVCDDPPDQLPAISGALVCEVWGLNGWCIGNETLELSATEPQGQQLLVSGEVDGTPFACPPANGSASCAVPLPEGAGTINYTATSTTGLSASGATGWMRDNTSPQIDGTLNGASGAGGWFLSEVEVSASALDPVSGLASLEYNLDGGAYLPYSAPFTLTDGDHSVRFRATDRAGNQSEITRSVNVDTSPPDIDMPGAWELGRVVGFEVQDSGSGLSRVRVVVADEHERFPKVAWQESLSGVMYSGEIAWDGRWGDGSLAVPGEYFAWVKATDGAGNEARRYGIVSVPQRSYSAPLLVLPTPTATFTPIPAPLGANLPAVPVVESASPGGAPPVASVAFGVSGKSAAQPASTNPIFWGAAAAGVTGAFLVEVARRKREKAKANQAGEARRGSGYLARVRAKKLARLEAEWAEERAQAEARKQAVRNARLTRKEALLEPEIPPEPKESAYLPPDVSWKQGDYAQLEHASEVAGESKPKSWGEKVFDWVDAHQTEVALGIGIAVGVAAVVLTAGAATPFLLAVGGAVLAAGGVVAAETVILNAHYGRSWGDNLLKNVAIASGAALVVTSIGMAVTGGVASGAVQQALYRGGNAITGYCSRHPVVCGRTVVGLELWDKLEDLGLQAKLLLQTARGDAVGAANTALELELERLDNMPGNTTFREIFDDVIGLLKKKGDETAQIKRTLDRLGVVVDIRKDGLINIGAGAAPDAIKDAIEELRRLPDRKVWTSGSTMYINSPTRESLAAVAKLHTAVNSGADDATKIRLIEEIVDASTHGSGDRVVLGAWKEKSGYIGEAVENGGMFFETGDEVWELIESTGIDPWLVNEQFLKAQLNFGVGRFDFVGDDVSKLISAYHGVDFNDLPYFRLKEIRWLEENASMYGYTRFGNSWIKISP